MVFFRPARRSKQTTDDARANLDQTSCQQDCCFFLHSNTAYMKLDRQRIEVSGVKMLDSDGFQSLGMNSQREHAHEGANFQSPCRQREVFHPLPLDFDCVRVVFFLPFFVCEKCE